MFLQLINKIYFTDLTPFKDYYNQQNSNMYDIHKISGKIFVETRFLKSMNLLYWMNENKTYRVRISEDVKNKNADDEVTINTVISKDNY